LKQQRKAGIKHLSRSENKKQKEVKDQGINKLQMHTYSDRQATGQRQEDLDETNKLLIQSF